MTSPVHSLSNSPDPVTGVSTQNTLEVEAEIEKVSDVFTNLFVGLPAVGSDVDVFELSPLRTDEVELKMKAGVVETQQVVSTPITHKVAFVLEGMVIANGCSKIEEILSDETIDEPNAKAAHVLFDVISIGGQYETMLALKKRIGAERADYLLLWMRRLSEKGEESLGANFEAYCKNDAEKMFYGTEIPGVSLKDYIARMCKCSSFYRQTLVIALIYMDRMQSKSPGKGLLDAYNVHRLFLVSLLVASKMYEDSFFSNKCFAKQGGVLLGNLNMMELDFFKEMDYDFLVDKDFHQFNDALHMLP